MKKLLTICFIFFVSCSCAVAQYRKTIKEMHPYAESGPWRFGPLQKSTFSMIYKGSRKNVIVSGISGLTAKDWFSDGTYFYFRNPKIIDGNKSIIVPHDNLWCEQYTKGNVFTWTGFSALAGFCSEDDLFKEYLKKKISLSEEVFFEKYPLLKQYFKTHFNRFSDRGKSTCNRRGIFHVASDFATGKFIGYLQFTRGEEGDITGGHAVTIYGVVTNPRKSRKSNEYYCGVVIADNNYNGLYGLSEHSEKELKIVGIHWDKRTENYCLEDDYKGFFTFIELFQAIEQTEKADLIWYRPNGWNSALRFWTKNAENPDVLYDTDDLLLDFAITNQGNKRTGKFMVALHIDDKLIQKFTVRSLAKWKIAAFTKYNIGKLTAGKHIFKVVIDPENKVSESYEQNNTFTRTVKVYPAGKIVVNSGEELILNNPVPVTIESGGRVLMNRNKKELSCATILPGGTLISRAGNHFRNTRISGKTACLKVYNGGIVSKSLISSGGYEDIFQGGVSREAQILAGGKILLAGGTAHNTQVNKGGVLYVRSYQGNLSRAFDSQIFSGGKIDVFNNSTARRTIIYSGGVGKVSKHGAMIDTVINSGGELQVADSGIVKNVQIKYGGLLHLQKSAPVISGDVLVSGQLKVNHNQDINAEKAKITIDLTQHTADDDYAIINLEYLGHTTLRITIPDNQKCGVYKIASKTNNWNGPVYLLIAGKKMETKLSRGKTINLGRKKYTLTNEYGNMLLIVDPEF